MKWFFASIVFLIAACSTGGCAYLSVVYPSPPYSNARWAAIGIGLFVATCLVIVMALISEEKGK